MALQDKLYNIKWYTFEEFKPGYDNQILIINEDGILSTGVFEEGDSCNSCTRDKDYCCGCDDGDYIRFENNYYVSINYYMNHRWQYLEDLLKEK